MEITKIASGLGIGPKDALSPSQASQDPKESFGAFLKQSFNDVNQLLSTSDKAASDMAVGKSESLHDAMISFEKAETAFKLLVQVRNKAIDAYHEIMRMQV